MKYALVLVVALVLGLLASGGVYLLSTSASVRQESPRPAAQGTPATPAERAASADQLAELTRQVAHLSGLLADLQIQVGELESAASREAVPVEGSAAPLPVAALEPGQLEHRVKEVLEAEKVREEEERAAQRRERDLQNAARRAERVANELGLSAADTNVLADHLFTSSEKRNELFTSMRESGFDRGAMRETFTEFNQWNSSELERLFGADLGVQIGEQTNDFGRGGGRGGRGGDTGGGGQRAFGNAGGGGN